MKKKHQECFQPYDQTWHLINKSNQRWTIETSSFFITYNVVQFVKLTNKRKHYKTLLNKYIDVHNQHNTYPPYAIVNVIMANHTTFDDEKLMHICVKCHSNLNKPQNVAYIIYYQPPSYMGTLLSTHPLHVQILSFIVIGMHMQSRNWGFTTRQIMETSLLNSPLLSWDGTVDNTFTIEEISTLIRPMFSQNI